MYVRGGEEEGMGVQFGVGYFIGNCGIMGDTLYGFSFCLLFFDFDLFDFDFGLDSDKEESIISMLLIPLELLVAILVIILLSNKLFSPNFDSPFLRDLHMFFCLASTFLV